MKSIKPWRLLLVDDDEDDFILTRSLLTDARPGKFKLDWVKTYEAGLEAFQGSSYHAYLVDYRLGEHDGLELVKEVVSAGCRAPIIVMTGQGSYDVDMEAMRVGATDYLSKGELSPPLLERTIRYAIGNKQAEEALRKAHEELELRVQERTSELKASKERLAVANQKLRAEIEERQRAEEALRKSETRFRTLAESTSSAIFILEGSKILYANPAVRIISGYTPEELLHQDFWAIAHPTYQELLRRGGLENSWKGAAYGGEKENSGLQIPSRYEIKILTKTGGERWVDLSIGEMVLDGKPALVVTAFDITERDLAEQALRQTKRELENRMADRTGELSACKEELGRTKERLAQALKELQASRRQTG